MKKNGLLLFFCLLLNNFVYSQQSIPQIIDSLHHLVEKSKDDSNKVAHLSALSYRYRGSKPDSSLVLAQQNLELSKKLAFKKGFALSYLDLAGAYLFLDNYAQSVYYCNQALIYANQISELWIKGMIVNMLGRIHLAQNNYKKSLEYFLEALEIRQKSKDSLGMAQTYNYIASVYDAEEDKTLVLEYYQKALKIRESHKDYQGIGQSLNNIGKVFQAKKDYQTALKNFQKAYQIDSLLKYDYGMEIDLNNIAGIFIKKGERAAALKIYKQVFDMRKSVDDRKGIVYSLISLADFELSGGNTEAAQNYAKQAEKVAQNYNLANELRDIYLILAKCYEKQQNIPKAFYFHKKGNELKDSLFHIEKNKITGSLKIANDLDKKEIEINLLQQKKIVQEKTARFKQSFALIILTSILVIAAILGKNYRKSLDLNKILFEQKAEIEAQNEELLQANEELRINVEVIDKQNIEIFKKGKNIINSINYAQKIQESILPFKADFDNTFGKDQFFVLYKPKDNVSGDFYWLLERNKKITVAVADCTGHGVPGAFMSVIGKESLDKIMSKTQHLEPHQILTLLNHHVRQILKQDRSKTNDGMDISLVQIDIENKKLAYSGAKIPLIYVQNGQFFKIKANSISIGGEQIREEQTFTTHCLDLENVLEFMFYMYSDGYQDQFGGKEDKKFMSKKLNELLESICKEAMPVQKLLLEQNLNNWMGKTEQTDDITVFGAKITIF